MRQRRWLVIASAFILVAIVGFVILQRGPLAQPPPPGDSSAGGPPADMPPDPGMAGPEAMPPGMGPDMGMGGSPAGGGGGGLEWSVTPSPEDKSMTYQEFCNRTGAAPNVPKQFTVDENGEDILATKNSWSQLQRVYAGGAVGVSAEVVEPGRVGKKLVDEAVRHAGYDSYAAMTMRDLYSEGAHGFAFKVGYPLTSGGYGATGPRTSDVVVGPMSIVVIMQVRPEFQRTYGQKVYDRMKKFDCLGNARTEGLGVTTGAAPFVVHTYRGGYYRPHILHLPALMVGELWGMLWSLNTVELSIKNRAGDVIYSARQPAGQGASILSQIIDPPQLYYNPKWKLLIPPEDLRFDGGRLNLNGTRGWAYMFNVDLPTEVAVQMHSATARLNTFDDDLRALGILERQDGASAGAGQAGGGMPGGPGDPGMPPEAMPGGPGAPPDAMPGGVPPPPM